MAACVCFLLGVLAGVGETTIAGALAIGVTALLYFKPEIEGVSTALKRSELVSVLQFLVASFIVLPILPGEGYGPYAVLNPRNIWLMVVLVSGIGLASHVALRLAGERRGVLIAGLLGGAVSSTATTVLYARRSAESAPMLRFAETVVPVANLVPLARIALIALVVAPSMLPSLAPMLGASLVAGSIATAIAIGGRAREKGAPMPESRNPAELGTALRFGAFYGVVLLVSAWLSDVAGARGLYAAAAASSFVDIDAIVLSSLNLFTDGRLQPEAARTAVAIAYGTNLVVKFAILLWLDRRLAWRSAGPFLAMLAGGAAGWLWL
jgi:uncharacterized membrane protein (DUF4010 family)